MELNHDVTHHRPHMSSRGATACTAILLFTCEVLSVGAGREASHVPVLWGDLRSQTHAVGFKVIYASDESRKWHAEGHSGDRPIRISVWYPAATRRDVGRMAYRQYVHYPATPGVFASVNAALEKRHMDSLRRSIPHDDTLQRLLNLETAALLDAEFANGRFPVIVYASGLNQSWQADNFVLCEYLASAGYIVLQVAQIGADSIQQRIAPADLKASVEDAEFAV